MLLDFFNLTIYRESLIEDHLLSPFCEKNSNFYKYRQDSIRGNHAYYSYSPKYNNTQLVKGTFVLNTQLMVIEKVSFSGKYEFLKEGSNESIIYDDIFDALEKVRFDGKSLRELYEQNIIFFEIT